MSVNRIKVGITHGDINSISYEVILNTLQDNRILEDCIPVIYGSAKVAAYHRKALKINNLMLNIVNSATEANGRKNYIINCVDENIRVELGKSTPMAGEASFLALEAAVADLKSKKIDVLVTGPINKNNIQSDKFNFKGHTEYLQAQFGIQDVLMFMVSDKLRIGVLTGHVPLKKVPELITENTILSKLKLMNQSLIQDFGIRKPKIAVLGLNPHAGDEGLLGAEESTIIIPALQKAREINIMAIGAFSADGFFGSNAYRDFDAVLAMYHDQGLIPFKALVYGEGVNFTAGLPCVRTSPAHGTAYELAGKAEASSESFRNALYLACDIFKTRQQYKELSSNPLKHRDAPDLQITPNEKE
jgi:4-hydroxythreonine-4-phosphate dehydrogenase